MVKKIKVIEDETPVGDHDSQEFQAKVLDQLQAIDWKLWEMMKIAQAWAEENGYTDTPPPVKKSKKKSDVTPIIVDEEDEDV